MIQEGVATSNASAITMKDCITVPVQIGILSLPSSLYRTSGLGKHNRSEACSDILLYNESDNFVEF